jgi:glycosyltransferase involved in cell wall biosynthesis
MYEATIITTCKGRRSFLESALSFMVLQCVEDYEILLVDYGDPDKSHELIERMMFRDKAFVHVLSETDFFNLNRARNIGAVHARSAVLAFVDADVILDSSWLSTVLDKIGSGAGLVVQDRHKHGASGTFAVTKDVFRSVGGFDESFTGWGYDDVDFFKRCAQNCSVATYSADLARPLHHTDRLRTLYYEVKDKSVSNHSNSELSKKADRTINPSGYAMGTMLYCCWPNGKRITEDRSATTYVKPSSNFTS